MKRPVPIAPAPGQESVWDYPRPPRLERNARRIRIVFAGLTVADSTASWRVLETSHPPVYYIPAADIAAGAIRAAHGTSFCEFKGTAQYVDVLAGGRVAARAGWRYPAPLAGFEPIAGHIAFYPAAMDACYVGQERVVAQPGDFYGGWVTSDVIGPFKGDPGTLFW